MRKSPSLFVLCAVLALWTSSLMAQPFTLGTTQVDVAAAPGFNHTDIPVTVTPGGSGFDFSLLQVASDSAWVTPRVDAAAGKIVLSFATTALTNASSTATISVTQGANAANVFVTVATAPLSIFKLTDDPIRSRTYGLQLQGLNRGSVVVLDPVTGAFLGNVTVGRKPTGMAVSNDGSELLVINSVDATISVIDLMTLRLKQTIALSPFDNWGQSDTTANIGVGPGNIIYYTDGAWAPPLRVLDRATGTVLQTVFIDPSSGYGFGDFALTASKNQLFGWAQYGWTAGWAGSYVSKFTVAASGLLTYLQSTSSSYPTPLGRDPLETPVLVGNDDATVFVKKWALAPATITTVKQGFPSDVYSISPGGEIAATSSALYQVSTGNKLYDFPFTTTVQAITSDYSRLVLFNATTRSFQSVDLYAAIGPQVMGRTLGPPDGSIVLSPAHLQWSALPGVDTYRVYLGTSRSAVTAANTSSPEYAGQVSAPSYALPGALTSGVTYYWRVDAVTSAGTTPGSVYSFTVSPVSSSTSLIDVATVRGHANFKTTVTLGADTPGTAWQASADQPWVTFTQSSGVTPATLEIVLNASALPIGNQTATITLSNGTGILFILPVKLKVEPLILTVIKSDPLSKYAYAISEDATAASPAAYLLEIDTQTEGITRVTPVGSSATDLAIHNADNRIYVPNWMPGSLRAIDKTSLSQVRTYVFNPYPTSGYYGDVYRVSAGGAGRVIVEEEDQWIYASIFNTNTGAKLGTTFQRQGGGAFDPTGRYYYHGDDNISNAEVRKFDTVGDIFTALAHLRVSSYSYYGSRVVVVSETGNRVFWNGSCFDASLVEQWTMAKETYSTTPDGRYAFGDTQIFDTVSKQAVLGMPATTRVSAFNSTTQKLVAQVGASIGFFPISAPFTLPAPVLSSGVVSATSVGLTWIDTSLETGFTLQQRILGAATWSNATTAPAQNATAATLTGLIENTIYEFRIKADSPVASSNWSNAVVVTTPPTPPTTPSLNTPATTSTSVTLSWTDSNKETGYVVERSPGTTNVWAVIATPAQNVLSYGDTTVAAQTSYSYRVKAVLGTLESLYSNIRTVTTPAPSPPATPSGFAMRVISASQIRLSWSDVLGETGYRLERRTDDPASWTTLVDLPANTTVFHDLTVQGGLQYWYRIKAINAAGSSAISTEASGTPVNMAMVLQDDFDPALDPMMWSSVTSGIAINGGVGFRGNNALWFGSSGTRSATTTLLNLIGQSYLEFSFRAGNQAVDGVTYWNDSEAGESVVVEYSVDGVSWTILQTLNTVYPNYSTWTDFVLTIPAAAQSANTRFRWRQLSHSGGTNDTWALDDVSVWAPIPPPPAAPPFLSAAASSSTSIAISWVASAGASSYQLERTVNGLTWTTIATTGVAQSYFTDTGLPASTWYRYRVRAANAGGVSPPSGTFLVATLSQIADWRLTNFGTMDPTGAAASGATGPDGMSNLAKFAFNMNVTDGVMFLTPSVGSTGLPNVSLDHQTQLLQVEFIRRKSAVNPHITYEVQFSSDLGGFAAAGSALQVTSIDSVWERVIWQDDPAAGMAECRFARVRLVELP